MSETYEIYADKIPDEVKSAVNGLHGQRDRKYAVLVLLIEENRLAFSEIKESLDFHSQEASNALYDLVESGLIVKKSGEDLRDKYSAYYEITEYAMRILDGFYEAMAPKRKRTEPPTRSIRPPNYLQEVEMTVPETTANTDTESIEASGTIDRLEGSRLGYTNRVEVS